MPEPTRGAVVVNTTPIIALSVIGKPHAGSAGFQPACALVPAGSRRSQSGGSWTPKDAMIAMDEV